jgi:hypothetical protein
MHAPQAGLPGAGSIPGKTAPPQPHTMHPSFGGNTCACPAIRLSPWLPMGYAHSRTMADHCTHVHTHTVRPYTPPGRPPRRKALFCHIHPWIFSPFRTPKVVTSDNQSEW